MKTIERDVIVVGAGPGGSTAAAYLAKAGIDVLLVDKEQFPRDKPCADAQSGRTIYHVKELGVLEKLASLGMPIRGILFTSPNYDEIFIDIEDGAGFITPRWIFDDLMRRTAETHGAKVLENCWVYDVIKEDGFVKGVKAKYQGEYIELRSKIVIGADGSHSMVAKAIDMFPDEDDNVTIALRTYYSGVDLRPEGKDNGYIEFHFDERIIPGYIWVFPSGEKWQSEGFCNVGLGLTDRSLYKDRSFEERIYDWIENSPHGAKVKGAQRVAPWKGWRVPSATQRMNNYDNGVMLIGDAGSVVIPLINEGVSAACDSAKFAADTAIEALEAQDYSAEFLKVYKERFDEAYDDRMKTIKIIEASATEPEVMNKIVYLLKNNEEFREKAFMKMFRG